MTPKPGILDPQGRAVERSLPHLGIDGVARRPRGPPGRAGGDGGRRGGGARRGRAAGRRAAVEPADRGVRGRGAGEAAAATATRGRPDDVRIGIVLFPGSNRDIDAVNARHAGRRGAGDPVARGRRTSTASPAILLPGGFAYGDYLRAGVIAHFSPVMRAVADFAGRGGPVLGICNGFQVLAEAGLVPGALLRNRGAALRVPRGRAPARAPRHAVHPRARGRARSGCRSPTARAATSPTTRPSTRSRRDGQVLWRYAARTAPSPGPTTPATRTARCAGSRASATPRATSPG